MRSVLSSCALACLIVAGLLGSTGCGSDVGPELADGGVRPGSSDAQMSRDSETGSIDARRVDAGADVDGSETWDGELAEGSLDAARVNALEQLGRPTDCLVCAEANCANVLDTCTSEGTATDGPAAGQPKAQLCVETLECVFSQGCSLEHLVDCYCTNPLLFEPPQCFRFGPCQMVFERSMGSTNVRAVIDGFADPTKGGTRAITLMQCLKDNRCATCFPSLADGGSDAGSD
jgi:hypothetical protein